MEKIVDICLRIKVIMRNGINSLVPDNIIVYDSLTMNKISRNR